MRDAVPAAKSLAAAAAESLVVEENAEQKIELAALEALVKLLKLVPFHLVTPRTQQDLKTGLRDPNEPLDHLEPASDPQIVIVARKTRLEAALGLLLPLELWHPHKKVTENAGKLE